MTPLRIGLLGCGTVGTQVARALLQQNERLSARAGCDLALVGIAVRRLEAKRDATLPPELFTTAVPQIISASDIVVELIGGLDPAGAYVAAALRAGKTVVTGNKALLAAQGSQLQALAQQHGGRIFYEAAVAGAVPIVRALGESLAGDQVQLVRAILNGTTNFILTQMANNAQPSYAAALKQAQAAGYAEADPSADVDGWDAAAKIALLAQLAFGLTDAFTAVSVRGIRDISVLDLRAAQAAGYALKLLAVAQREEPTSAASPVTLSVCPTFLPQQDKLAQVDGVLNAVEVRSSGAGSLLFSGAGAGGEPTAAAVLGDLVMAARRYAEAKTAVSEKPPAAAPNKPLPATDWLADIQQRGAQPYALRLSYAQESPNLGAARQQITQLAQEIGLVVQREITLPAAADLGDKTGQQLLILAPTTAAKVKEFGDTLPARVTDLSAVSTYPIWSAAAR